MPETPQHIAPSEAVASVNASEKTISESNLSSEKSPKQNQGRRYSYLMMIAHLCDDLNQGALVAVIPFLVLHNGYSYAEVTAASLGIQRSICHYSASSRMARRQEAASLAYGGRHLPCRYRHGRSGSTAELSANYGISHVKWYWRCNVPS